MIDVVTGRVIGTLHQREALRVFTRPAAELEADIRAVLPDPDAFTIDIDNGVVTVHGHARFRSQVVALVESVRAVEGVIDVVSDVTAGENDLIVVPPLLQATARGSR